MNSTLTDSEFKLFKKYIEEKCGIDIPEEKSYLIEIRLSKILADSGLRSYEELFYDIRQRDDKFVSEKIIDSITTNETLWFRDKSPWIVLEELMLPIFISEIRNNKRDKVRIWSAASSTGQEAYSTAICIDNYLNKNEIKDVDISKFEILATDISNEVLEVAKNGKYDSISIIRGLDPNYKNKYFDKNNMVWQIKKNISKIVKFQRFNLQNSFMLLGNFDVIFCRYVLIYFSDKLRKDIFSKISFSLNNHGTFFLGASEIYTDTENYFDIHRYKNGIHYKRKVIQK
ncbi:MAG: protein-glutamate O-methyltransferase CheR [Clostridiales bacterium]